jgi:GNAT superfamily N-acetyltransferase
MPSAELALLRWFTICSQLKVPVQLYLGIWKGMPVATSMYLLAAGVAGVHFVATIPEARKRGFGYAITQKSLQDARQKGYRIGVLQASKLGYPVYTKLGFKEYSQFGVYTWRQNSLPK